MTSNTTDALVDRIGVIAIALISLGYVVFSGSFAELRLQLPFLRFPIFVGEILLAFCLVLFTAKAYRRKLIFRKEHWIIIAYFSFVFIKTVCGYWTWGPLALRDAALFYYPSFALLSYCFWTPGGLGRWGRRIAFAVLLLILLFRSFHFFWPFSLIVLALILARREEESPANFLFIAAVLLLAPYDTLFLGVRTVVVASIISIIFVVISLVMAARLRQYLTFVWLALGLMVAVVFVLKVASSDFWKRVDLSAILGGLRPPATVVRYNLPAVKLYNPDGSRADIPNTLEDFYKHVLPQSGSAVANTVVPAKVSAPEAPKITDPVVPAKVSAPEVPKTVAPVVPKSAPVAAVPTVVSAVASPDAFTLAAPRGASSRPLGVDTDNARFRLYIWRDMAIEYWQKKPLFGFDFGYPLRSPSMSNYGFVTAQDEDGWLGAHNSFFYLIYRGGSVGLAMVCLILVFWGGLVRDMIGLRTLGGVLLCAVLLNWMVAANFFLIFELPYTAIPFWTLFGITAKYRSFLIRNRRGGGPLPRTTPS